MAKPRIVLDVSTLARWTGPAVGMVRVEFELAKAARGRPETCQIVFYDPRTGAFRQIRPEWIETILGWDGAIDTWGVDYSIDRRGWRRWVPSRYPLLRALERRRLTARSRLIARAVEALQTAILAPRSHSFPFRDATGRRILLVPPDLALGFEYRLGDGDTLLSAASDWRHKNIEALGVMKRRHRFRLVAVCYDLLPISHPEFFPASDTKIFAQYWTRLLPATDTLIVNSRAVRDDVLALCAAQQLSSPDIVTLPLGYERPVRASTHPRLPAGLEKGRYALFVSTIEPRKNHAMLVRIWKSLLARGIPQPDGFKLVFVGRRGWMVDALLTEIADRRALQDTLLHLEGVDDEQLESLYAEAAFCLYPSIAEGFGLPVVEAFARGKAVIVSSGGSLPEVAADLAPLLDPRDEAGWEQLIAAWIQHPQLVRAAERRVADGFAHPTWAEVAQRMLAEAA